MQTSEENRGRTYCIALNFWGSKFSRIVVFEDFVLLKWFHEFAAHACCTSNMLWASHTSLASVFNMYHAVTLLSGWACSCQQSNAYFEGISLERVPWCFPLTLLQSEHENCVTCQKFLLKYFCKQFKICEIHKIKDLWKFSTIQYVLGSIFDTCIH